MAAVLGRLPVCLHHHRHRVPAEIRFEATLESAIARILRFTSGGNTVDVRGIRLKRQISAAASRVVNEPFQDEVCTLSTVRLQQRVNGLEPLLCFNGVEIVQLWNVSHTDSLLRCFARQMRWRPRKLSRA